MQIIPSEVRAVCRRWAVLASVGLVGMVGCGESGRYADIPPSADSVRRVRVVERSVVGGTAASGPAALADVSGVVLFPRSGIIAAVDGMNDQLHFFGLDGAYVRAVGSKGGGPGEFRTLQRAGAVANGGFCAWDIQLARVTSFDSAGAVIRTVRAEFRDLWNVQPTLVGFTNGCGFIVADQRQDMSRAGQQEGLYRDSLRLVRFDSTGTLSRWLGSVPTETRGFDRHDGGFGSVDLLFGRRRFAQLDGDEVLVLTTDSLAWSRLDPDGAVVGRVFLPTSSRSVNQADIEAERRRRVDSIEVEYSSSAPVARIAGPALTARFKADAIAAVENVEAESTFPAFDLVTVGANGVLWFRLYPRPSDIYGDWLAVDRDGRVLGNLTLPVPVTIAAASHNWIVVQERDALDAPVLRILAIEGGIGPPDP